MTLSDVSVIVIATTGGAALDDTLGRLVGAAECLVVAPADRVPLRPGWTRDLPATMARARAPWLGLVMEGEDAAAAFGDVPDDGGHTSGRFVTSLRVFGTTLTSSRGAVRCVRRDDAEVVVTRTLQLAFAPGRAPASSGAPLQRRLRDDLADAVGVLNAESTACAHLVVALGAAVPLRRILLAPWIAGARMLTSRAGVPLGWGRWIVGVLAAYQAVVTAAKCWELRRQRAWEPVA